MVIFLFIFVLITFTYNLYLLRDIVAEPLLEKERKKHFNNSMTIVVPIDEYQCFDLLYQRYLQSEYQKKSIIYCFKNLSEEEFGEVKAQLGLFIVPFLNDGLQTKAKFDLYYSQTNQQIYILNYYEIEDACLYNTIVNISKDENIVMTKANVFIGDESLKRINDNINAQYQLQTGISVSRANITSDFGEINLKIPILKVGTYKLIRQIEKLIYDKHELLSIGGYDNDFVVFKRRLLMKETGFKAGAYALDDLVAKVALQKNIKQILDSYIVSINYSTNDDNLVKSQFKDKYKTIKLFMGNLQVSSQTIKPQIEYALKKLLRFFNVYINLFLIIALLAFLVINISNAQLFSIYYLVLFFISVINYVVTIFLFFNQEYRTALKLYYIPISSFAVYMAFYLLIIRTLGLVMSVLSLFKWIIRRGE